MITKKKPIKILFGKLRGLACQFLVIFHDRELLFFKAGFCRANAFEAPKSAE
jgi:hypothetical protein